MAAPRLSLWLAPSGTERQRLKQLIDSMASETVGCLPFEPHLTLISDDQVPEKSVDQVLELVSESVKQWNVAERGADEFELEFSAIQSGALFYQCVLIAVVPSSPLLSLNGRLRAALVPDAAARAAMPVYFPHLSIVYGDLAPAQKSALVATVKESLKDMHGFRPKEILLVQTSGPSSEWKQLGKVNLDDGKIELAS